ncbi:FkbM family methyltransferase [Xanthomonas bonasiae]|uniref:FkbM family methyltransferase n=1 Tax=Xanthomonas bonasiae TaxID=2810351 RepID=UPI00198200D3|nr:FkbM family methyltransferase [Xanthomonas bonasiae]MBN6113099.1 FkbM family methyltransferase [Xanthomonas bonasiae]
MQGISEDAVTWAYRLFLDREPEDGDIVRRVAQTLSTTQELRHSLLRSDEFLARNSLHNPENQSVFFHYAASFDPIEVMQRHAARDVSERADFLINFLGVAIDPKFFPSILADRRGKIEAIPIPANWHADIAEWGAALRAVDLSRDSFTVIELGCGWGCWLNNTGVAARALGREVTVIGIEGDEHHLGFARESLATNGFLPDQIVLHRGIAASRSGVALFPRQDVPGTSWGSEPIFGASEQQRQEAVESGAFDEVPMLALGELMQEKRRVDLLHVDIQGGEADLIEQSLALLKERVAYIVIGTHSKQIEGRLYSALLSEGWQLEMERPAIFRLVDGTPEILVDGVQGWRNPVLLPIE